MTTAGQRHIVIIGAGISGLSTAVHAAQQGFDVEVLEHHTEPGGVCTAWQRGGYTIDGCIQWLMGAKPGNPLHQLYRDIGALDGVELRPLTSFARVHDEFTQTRLEFGADLDALVRDAEAISPSDAAPFRELVEGARKFAGMPMPIERAPELQSFAQTLHQLWSTRSSLSMMMRNFEPMAALADRVNHPGLKYALREVFLPEVPVAFAMMVLSELHRGELATVVGGSQRFAKGIERRLLELGGRIRYGADVETIVVENDRATGVRLIDGTVVQADHVVSTAPGPTTIFGMLGGRYTDAKLRERYATWPKIPPIALVSFGCSRRFATPDMLRIRLADPFALGPDEVRRISVRNMAYDASLAPPGGSVVQAMVETNFDLWHDLHHAHRPYGELKHTLAEAVEQRLGRYFPGLSDAIEVTDVATPYTFWRYARSYRGCYEGWLPTRQTLRVHPSKTLPGLRGFHMAGQWTEPGGGIPPSVMSGRHVVQLICREYEVPFKD